MNLKQIQELIKFVAKSGATEVNLEMGDVKICIKSPPKGKINLESQTSLLTGQQPVVQQPVVQQPVVQQPIVPIPQPTTTNLSNHKETAPETPVDITNDSDSLSSGNHEVIKSPIIGTFYRKPSPEKDPFVSVGDRVETGSVVGIVEAMKLFNEIESEISGTIIKVLVEDMSPVEYDQPLFLVDKN
mgnify:CR=1 FL=1|tara:strand:+ start:6231 stop:6788 length:558 start_codon:yes stop_codon:yes gene_type:complete